MCGFSTLGFLLLDLTVFFPLASLKCKLRVCFRLRSKRCVSCLSAILKISESAIFCTANFGFGSHEMSNKSTQCVPDFPHHVMRRDSWGVLDLD